VINFESLVSINWKTIFIKMAVVLVHVDISESRPTEGTVAMFAVH